MGKWSNLLDHKQSEIFISLYDSTRGSHGYDITMKLWFSYVWQYCAHIVLCLFLRCRLKDLKVSESLKFIFKWFKKKTVKGEGRKGERSAHQWAFRPKADRTSTTGESKSKYLGAYCTSDL